MFTPTDSAHPADRAVVRVPLDSILSNPCQPRSQFPPDSISELAASIRRHGLLSPLLVRRAEQGRYRLVAGERRLRALRQLGRSRADVVILEAGACDCDLIALVENLQREDLHFLDEAAACRRILDRYPITQDRLAACLSRSPSALANKLRLLKLPERVRSEIRRLGLSERHARALLTLDSEAGQLALAALASEQRLSVKQLEAQVERLRQPAPPRRQISPAVRDNRIVVNALLETVRELAQIGVPVKSRVEEQRDRIDVIVSIPILRGGALPCSPDQAQAVGEGIPT